MHRNLPLWSKRKGWSPKDGQDYFRKGITYVYIRPGVWRLCPPFIYKPPKPVKVKPSRCKACGKPL